MANDTVFLTPYQTSKVLEGVLSALPVQRPNFLQTFFADVGVTDRDTVNFDQELSTRNTMGMFVDPNADVTPITLGSFGHKELSFAYSKEGWVSDDYEELAQRQLGQDFGQTNVLANQAARLVQKATLAEQRHENLFELCASHIMLYGAYQASSEKHPAVYYDFGRTTATTEAQANAALAPAVNLTASAVVAPWNASQTILPVITWTGGGTPRKWTTTNVDAATATPVKDITKMFETAQARVGLSAIIMSQDAYTVFNYDVEKYYASAANNEVATIISIQRDIIPQAQQYRGLTFRRSWVFGNGGVVPIYTYNAVYHDRITGTETKYIGDGWVIGVPPATSGVKRYGRIKHPKAMYSAMPRWINYWVNGKTGKEEWESHTNFLLGTKDIDATIAWKVA